jgi:hypothetical protein
MQAHPSPNSPLFRSSRRITITVPHHAFSVLQERSDQEGRSLSNLAAYLLESSIDRSNTTFFPSHEDNGLQDPAQRPHSLTRDCSWS